MPNNLQATVVWRRVGDLEGARAFAEQTLSWARLPEGPDGQDPHVVMYDAGGVLVGLSTQRADCGGNCCSAISMTDIPMTFNPASRLLLAAPEPEVALRRLAGLEGLSPEVLEHRRDTGMQVTDQYGNNFEFVGPDAEDSAHLTERVRNLARETQMTIPNPVLGVELRVANVERSVQFYRDTLELPLLTESRSAAAFDAGPLTIGLREETTIGMTRQLHALGRLQEDWVVFHVDDLDEAIIRYRERGIDFPVGEERWDDGRLAYFNDPDGHYLSLWEPAGQGGNVAYEGRLGEILATPS
jgi:predicted enzyme related to lactoylglutathione lyase